MKRGEECIKKERDDAVKGIVYVGNARGDLEMCGKILENGRYASQIEQGVS